MDLTNPNPNPKANLALNNYAVKWQHLSFNNHNFWFNLQQSNLHNSITKLCSYDLFAKLLGIL